MRLQDFVDCLAAVREIFAFCHRYEPQRHGDTKNKKYFMTSVPPWLRGL